MSSHIKCDSCSTDLDLGRDCVLTCSRCFSPKYCSQSCYISHHLGIGSELAAGRKAKKVLTCDIRRPGLHRPICFDKEIRPFLRKEGVDNCYQDLVKSEQISFVERGSKIQEEIGTVQSHEEAIYLITDDRSDTKARLQSFKTCLAALTARMQPVNSKKYTKFTFYLKVHLTLRSVARFVSGDPRTRRYYLKIDTDFGDRWLNSRLYTTDVGERVRYFGSLPKSDLVKENLRTLRGMALKLVGDLSLNTFKEKVLDGSSGIHEITAWLWVFKRFQKVCHQTEFVEYFPDTFRRAYNEGSGERLVITMRSSVDPCNLLLDVDGLFLLLLHELSHTLATIHENRFSTIDGMKPPLGLTPEDSHGPRFQRAMVYLFSEAHRQGAIPFKCETFDEYEMALRKAHQDSSFGIRTSIAQLIV